MYMLTAVILPTWSRVEQAALCTRRLLETSSADVVIITEDDISGFGDLQNNPRVLFDLVPPGMTAVQKWNHGLKMHPNYQAYVLGADDLWAHDGWHDEVLRVQSESQCGFVGINDGRTDGSILSTHYMMTREFIVFHHGGVMAVPHYSSWGIDEEATMRAKSANQFVYAQHAILEHRHYLWGKAQADATYMAGRRSRQYDIAIVRLRNSMGWPNDFERVIE